MKISTKLLLALGVITALVGGTVGGAVLSSPLAQAQDVQTSDPIPAKDPSLGGHVGTNGVKEEVLTGDTADKVKAATLAAHPGGTIQRVETDAEGSPYEAHMTKSDGTVVTVKLDSNFQVTATQTGHR